MKLGIALGSAIVCGTCVACVSHVVVPEDPNVYDPNIVSCENACRNLHGLGCSSGADVVKCVTFCARVQRSGYLTLPINCICHATTRSEARLCGTKCPE